MLSDVEKCAILDHVRNKDVRMENSMQSLHPDRKITVNDILDRSWLKNKKRWRNNNRLRKKFANRWIHYVSYEVYAEVMGVLLSAAIRHRRNYDELGRRAFKVEPLPAGALRACSSVG